MKKNASILGLCLILALALTACGARYDGSRLGNSEQLTMEYTYFNGTDSQRLELAAGDTLRGEIVSRGGGLKIVIRREGDAEPVFETENAPSSSFEVEVEQAGAYEVELTGRRARGSVDIRKM